MKKLVLITILASTFFFSAGCKEKRESAINTGQKEAVDITLYDKPLSEIKKYVNGKWELVTGQNSRELNEFENTFIEFKGDDYIWTEEGKPEKGKLNWRKAQTGNGYEAYFMDVFYADFPSYPISIKGDTLYIQDNTQTSYKYTLVRR